MLPRLRRRARAADAAAGPGEPAPATTRSSARTARCGRRGRAWPRSRVDLTAGRPAPGRRRDHRVPRRRRRHLRATRASGPGPWQLDPMPLVIDAAVLGAARGRARPARRAAQRDPGRPVRRAAAARRRASSRPPWSSATRGFTRVGRPRRGASTRARWSSRPPTSAATPTGEWRVLADRVQAPSGLGYAMENRRVISRVLPELYREAGLHRMEPYFSALRSALLQSAPGRPGRPARRRALAGHALRDGVRPGVRRQRPGLPARAGQRPRRPRRLGLDEAAGFPQPAAGAGRRDPAPRRRRLVRPARAARRAPSSASPG